MSKGFDESRMAGIIQHDGRTGRAAVTQNFWINRRLLDSQVVLGDLPFNLRRLSLVDHRGTKSQ